MRRCVPHAVLCLFIGSGAAFAQASCPTAADLETGIQLVRSEPFYSNVMTISASGLSEARMMQSNGVPEEVSSTYSHGLAITQRIGADGVLTLDYDDDVTVLDRLPQIGSWTSDVTLSEGGAVQDSGTYTLRFMEAFSYSVGNCTYTTWHVRTALALDGSDTILMDTFFAPDLGISLASIRLDMRGNPVSGVVFDQIKAR